MEALPPGAEHRPGEEDAPARSRAGPGGVGSSLRFVALMVALRTALALAVAPVALLVEPAGVRPGDMVRAGMTPAEEYFTALVLAPLLETAALQWLPFEAALRLGCRHLVPVMAVSALAFALAHVPGYGAGGFLAAVPGAIPLAYTYGRWRRYGVGRAFGLTALIHAAINLESMAAHTLLAALPRG